jgi:hypothetical protein
MAQNWRYLGINLLIINKTLPAERVELRSDNQGWIGWQLPRKHHQIRIDIELPMQINWPDWLLFVRERFTILNGSFNIGGDQ